MSVETTRRSFLTAGAAAGATILTGELAARVPSGRRALRIGALGATAYSFWGIWADLLSSEGRMGTKILNMEVTHVWDRDFSEAEKFAARWDIQAVRKYDDMIGKVDGVVAGGLYETPWQHKVFRPYLKAGMPCCLSRPWAGCVRDLDEMLDLAAKHGSPLMATVPYEHYNEAEALKDKLENVGTIRCVQATDRGGDFPHFHIQYMMPQILGYDVDQVALLSDDLMKPNYLQNTHIYTTTEAHPAFTCTMNSAPGTYIFRISVVGSEATELASMPGNSSSYYRFVPQMVQIQKTLEGSIFQPLDVVRKKFEIFMAAQYSHHERGGAPVKVGAVPVEWGYPPPAPGWMDDSLFLS